jgi:hypothetical protein
MSISNIVFILFSLSSRVSFDCQINGLRFTCSRVSHVDIHSRRLLGRKKVSGWKRDGERVVDEELREMSCQCVEKPILTAH